MQIGVEYIFVIVAFIVIIMLSSYGSAIIVPYQKDELFSKQFKYEGMHSNIQYSEYSEGESEDESEDEDEYEDEYEENFEEYVEEDVEEEVEEKSNANPFSFSSFMTPITDMIPGAGNLFASSDSESFEGMYGLSPYEFDGSDLPLDRLSRLRGGANCDPSLAAGYSNSKGPLCMDDTTLKLLRTRGGNQSGAPSQIGQ